ncbi:ATP-binding protein [Streptomyces sp. NBC_01474]|nr:ATP-binding protein [Streptomyces sp. NBC_01474]
MIPGRLLHHCNIVPTNGNSCRLKNHIIALRAMAMSAS